MSTQHNSVSYSSITVSNVYCDMIRVSKCTANDSYIATFTFSSDAGVHGLLLGEVKKQYKETSYVVSGAAIQVTCDPAIIDRNTCVVNSEYADTDILSANRSRRHSRTTLSMVKLSSVAHCRPILMARVNITFRDVSVYKDSSVGKDTWFVNYSSFDASVLSPMRVREHTL